MEGGEMKMRVLRSGIAGLLAILLLLSFPQIHFALASSTASAEQKLEEIEKFKREAAKHEVRIETLESMILKIPPQIVRAFYEENPDYEQLYLLINNWEEDLEEMERKGWHLESAPIDKRLEYWQKRYELSVQKHDYLSALMGYWGEKYQGTLKMWQMTAEEFWENVKITVGETVKGLAEALPNIIDDLLDEGLKEAIGEAYEGLWAGTYRGHFLVDMKDKGVPRELALYLLSLIHI